MPTSAPYLTPCDKEYNSQDPNTVNIFKRHTPMQNMRPAHKLQTVSLEHISQSLVNRLADKMNRLEQLKA